MKTDRKKHFKLLGLIENVLNRINLREKIIGLFIFCVIIPLICVDGIIIQRIMVEEKEESKLVAENMAESVYGIFEETLRSCQSISTSINQNYRIGEILGEKYDSVFDYYEMYHKMTDNYFFQTLVRFDNMQIKLYTSNDTVVTGGYVGRVDTIEDAEWYRIYKESNKDNIFMCEYDASKSYNESKRRLCYVAKLKFNNNNYDNFLRIDVDYGTVARRLENMGHRNPIYVCNDNTVLFSNYGNNSTGVPFEEITDFDDVLCYRDIENLGNINRIIIFDEKHSVADYLYKNRLILIIVLFISVVFPGFVMYEIDYSIVHRIERLNNVFGKRVNDELVRVENPEGSDELGNLMFNYNKMADQVNNLIQIVYKDRLREQESNIAKKNAELLALHSQINPHFMFNALESIRMHSLIKGENETAEMVEKLAIMERQYVDWGSDMLKVSQEMSSVEAYLVLQKYRFGDRLMYELSVDEDCEDWLIPKLTVVTFVENACVHGMENKTSECWVFVRVYRKDMYIVIEVEDTGNGMDEEKVKDIVNKAKTIELDDLKNIGHVGIYNALLRLKMTMGERYVFDIETEEGIGTLIQIKLPIDA